jgi:hypothetical protein
MRRRPAVTLLEVLVALFILGIGMLALLALFPLGALSMGRALQDDRVAGAAAMAENVALAFDVRHDSLVAPAFTNPFGTALPASYTGPSYPVYVDPWGYLVAPAQAVGAWGGSTVGLPRRSVSFSAYYPARGGGALTSAEAGRWFTLPDDVTFATAVNGGVPDLSSGSVQRGGRYTWAYLLRRPNATSDAVVDLTVVVYSRRPTQSPPLETAFQVVAGTGAAGTNTLTLGWTAGQAPPNLRRGAWVLDTSADANGIPCGNFYRVVNVAETATANQLQLELETNLKSTAAVVAVMEDVAEVFYKGPGWQP